MCGIIACLGTSCIHKVKNDILERSRRIRHRGPEWTGMYCDENNVLIHERLAIVGGKYRKQPIYHNNRVLIANGEIYNYKEL